MKEFERLLFMKDGLAVISEALEKIRESVKFVKGSETRENMFQNCMETVDIQAEASLVLDVTTRWNSTHLMLSRAIEFKDALRNLAEVDRSYKSLPNDLEWKRAEFNDILAIAAVLDPRLKFAFLEYCYNTLDQSTSQTNLAHVRSKMVKLFGTYERNTSNITSTTSQVAQKDVPSGYGGFYSYYSQKTCGGPSGSGKSALDIYLDEPVLDMVAFRGLDVIAYWKDNSSRFKELASMACDVFSIPITTVASESSFSIGSRVLNKYRSCLLPMNVQASRNWYRGFQEIGVDDEIEFSEEEGEKASHV